MDIYRLRCLEDEDEGNVGDTLVIAWKNVGDKMRQIYLNSFYRNIYSISFTAKYFFFFFAFFCVRIYLALIHIHWEK